MKKINLGFMPGKVGGIPMLFVCLFCWITSPDKVNGQSLANSPYSYFGIGSILEKGSSHNRSLGGTGIGLRDGYSINNINPASYTAIAAPFTQLTDFGLITTFGVQEENGKSSTVMDMDFTGMAIWFRMPANWAVTLGLSPYSNVQYDIISEESLIGFGTNLSTNYVGSGGLSNLYFGMAHTFFNHLSIGANASYIFGALHSEQHISSSSIGNGWNISERTHLQGFKLDVGMQYSFRWKKSELTLGAVLDLGNGLNGTHFYEITQNETITEEEESSVGNYSLPAAAGFGLSYGKHEKWRVSLDFSAEQWSGATFEEGYQLHDTQRISFGIETLPDPRDPSYLKRVSFSIGAFHEENYLTISDYDLTTSGISAGIKFPTARAAQIQFTADHFVSGNSNLVLQRYTQLGLNISFFDLWFTRRRID